jgi:hypothetical protein
MLLNWPDAPANTRQVLESLLAELATPMPTAITSPAFWRRWRRRRMPITGTSLLGAIALFLSHLSGKQPLDPPG